MVTVLIYTDPSSQGNVTRIGACITNKLMEGENKIIKDTFNTKDGKNRVPCSQLDGHSGRLAQPTPLLKATPEQQSLTGLEGTGTSIPVLRHVEVLLSVTDRTVRRKKNQQRKEHLNHTCNKIDIIDRYSDIHPTIAQRMFSPNAHKTFSKTDCALYHQANLNHFQRME